MLVVAYSEDKVFLDYEKNLHDSNSVDVNIALGGLEDNAFSPLLGGSECEQVSLRVSCKYSQILSLFDIERANPDVTINSN